VPKKQTSPRRNATRRPPGSAAAADVIDLAVARARNEPDLAAVFGAHTRPEELAGPIARILMREVSGCRTALAAELILSELMGMARLACPPKAIWGEQSEAVDALMSAVTVLAERDGAAAALALLRVIAVLAVPEVSVQAGAAAERLADQGIPDRPWVRSLGRPRFLRAWRYGDLFGFQESVNVLFDYASREHVASVLIDHPLGGGIKDAWVAEGKHARRSRALTAEQMAGNPDAFLEDLVLGEAHDLLGAALGNQPCPEQDDQIHDVACYLPLVTARVALLGTMAGDKQ
jgi:hypothetical protein